MLWSARSREHWAWRPGQRGRFPGGRAGQGYPFGPIKLIAPFAAGGSNEGIARPLGQLLTENLKQTVGGQKRPGAGGKLGVEQAFAGRTGRHR